MSYRTWATIAAGLSMSLAGKQSRTAPGLISSWNPNRRITNIDELIKYRKQRKKKNAISAQALRKNRRK